MQGLAWSSLQSRGPPASASHARAVVGYLLIFDLRWDARGTFAVSQARSDREGCNLEIRCISAALCWAVALAVSAPASTQDLRPGIIGRDHRVSVEDMGPPWDAVGQVNISGYRMLGKCTVTLVASNLVLTAAHCVMDPWAKAPYSLRSIHFLAGVRGARHKGHSVAKCLRFLQGYMFVPPEKILPTKRKLPGQNRVSH
jgi:hypothetical protein